MKQTITIFFLVIIYSYSYSQGEIDDQNKIIFRNERTFSAFMSSYGWGLNYQYAKRVNAYKRILYDFDIDYIKHPKEKKQTNPFFMSSNMTMFVFGKTNLFFELKGSYGQQRELFRKIDKGGIAIRMFYSGGASLGVLKPIYYQIIYPSGAIDEKFVPNLHYPENIIGRSSFLKGFSEISVVPGAFVKIGGSFEYSTKNNIVKALDLGISATLYPKPIEILALTDNSQLFVSLFVAYRFGKILSSHAVEQTLLGE